LIFQLRSSVDINYIKMIMKKFEVLISPLGDRRTEVDASGLVAARRGAPARESAERREFGPLTKAAPHP
jgi:hypothetical protein